MKTIYKSILLIATTAFALNACSQREDFQVPNENEEITLKFNIRNADEPVITKALLGTENRKYFLDWENGDKIGTFSVGSFPNDQTTSNNNAGSVEVSGNNYTLNVQTFNAGTVTDIYSYFPYSAAAGKNKAAAVMTIPASQFMDADGFDADAMPMAGAPVTVDLTTTANTDTPCGTINFFNLGSIINFKIYSSTDTDETLTSVKYISGTGNLGGNYTIDLTGIDGNNETTLALGGTGSDAEITTTHRAAPAIGTGKENAIDVYMVVAPGTYSGTQVVVTTSAKTYTLNASGEKTYNRSSIKPMYVDIQKGTQGEVPEEETWTKVTNASDFTAGTYYILRADGAYYVPNGKGNPSCVVYTAGDAITNAMKWNATVSGDGLVFESVSEAGNYLWTTNTGSANTITVAETSTGEKASNVWSFASITVGDNTYYTATAGESKYLVSYGTSNWRYYATGNINNNNIPAEFYKLQAGDIPQKETPELAFNNPTTIVNVEETVTNIATINPSTLAVTYSSSNEDVATVTSAGVVTGVAPGTATITASFAGNETYNEASVSYEITVVDPNGNDGSAEKPYLASEAATIALGGSTQSDVYVKGIISKITTAFNSQYSNVSFDISDNGLTSGSQFRIYRTAATSADDFKVGDAVTFKGKFTVFQTTPEFEEGSELISQLLAPRFSPDGGSFTGDSQSVTLTSDSGAEIRYTFGETLPSSTTGTVYSGAITITATTTINALAVKDGIVTGVVSKTFTKNSSLSADAVFDYPTLYSSTTSGSVNLDGASNVVDGVKIEYAKVSGNNAPQYYANGTNLRIYNESTMTFTAPSGKKITAIDFNQGTTTWASGKMSGDSGSINDTDKKWINASGASTVVLTITGSFRFTKIVVTYE